MAKMAAQWTHVAAVTDVAKGESKAVKVGDARSIALFNVDGRIYATDNQCPHMGYPLTRGAVRNGIVTCDWHGRSFDLRCLFAVRLGVKGNQALLGRTPVLPIVGRFEHGAQAIVIRLRNRVVAMVVALRAADRKAKQRRGDDLDRVGDDLVTDCIGISHGGCGGAVRAHAQKARGDQPLP